MQALNFKFVYLYMIWLFTFHYWFNQKTSLSSVYPFDSSIQWKSQNFHSHCQVISNLYYTYISHLKYICSATNTREERSRPAPSIIMARQVGMWFVGNLAILIYGDRSAPASEVPELQPPDEVWIQPRSSAVQPQHASRNCKHYIR